MKKILALMLIVWLVLAAGGCGTKTADVSLEDDQSKPVELVWYTIGPTPKDLDMVMAKVNEYTKTKLNCTLKLVVVDYGDYEKKVQTLAVGGEQVDIMFTASWALDYRSNAAKGMFHPMNELLQKYGQGTLKALDPLLFEGTKFKGENYAIPGQGSYASQLGYFFNKNIVDKYNFDFAAVKKLTDLMPLFAKIKADNPNITPVHGTNFYGARDKFDYMIAGDFPGVVRMDDPKCKVINQYEDQEFLSNLKQVREVYLAKYSYQDITKQGSDADFGQGRVACEMTNYHPFEETMMTRKYGFPVSVVLMLPHAVITSNSVAGAMVAISTTSKNPTRAMKLLNLVNTDPYLMNLLYYGIEGVHYTKVSDKQVHITPEGRASWDLAGWGLGNQYICYVPDTEPADKWEQYAKFDHSGVRSPLFGFVFDARPVEKEIVAINSFMAQYTMELKIGACDIDKGAAAYTEKCKAAGMDKLFAEWQKQIDEWLKTKK